MSTFVCLAIEGLELNPRYFFKKVDISARRRIHFQININSQVLNLETKPYILR
jgi:hypothetical protein